MKTMGQALGNLLDRLKSNKVLRSWTGDDWRSRIAQGDEMPELSGEARSRIPREISEVISLCESPIEQTALYHLAGRNYSPSNESAIFAHVVPSEKVRRPDGADVVIVPQVKLGPYRVDFLLILPNGRKIAVECDGAAFHDPAKDARRDAVLLADLGIHMVFRVSGRDIWRGYTWTDDVIKAAARMGGWS